MHVIISWISNYQFACVVTSRFCILIESIALEGIYLCASQLFVLIKLLRETKCMLLYSWNMHCYDVVVSTGSWKNGCLSGA